jgi:pyridoxal phosphate enzyme (YggS family)
MPEVNWEATLRENVRRVRERIAAACQASGREAEAVRLVAVTKYVSTDVARALVAAGVQDLGENRAQQLVARAEACGAARSGWCGPDDPAAGPCWHMIGHVQRNKVRPLLDHSRIIHSLDSKRLADALEARAASLGVEVDVLIEVNVAGEASKQGVDPGDVSPLVAALTDCRHLRLRGLMTMAPYNPDPEAARPVFVRLRELLAGLRSRGEVSDACRELSMGMSQDYGVAVEEGATVVRVGSALYENLPTTDPRKG